MSFKELKEKYYKEHKAEDYDGVTEKEVKEVCKCYMEDYKEFFKGFGLSENDYFYAYYNDCFIIRNIEDYKIITYDDYDFEDDVYDLYTELEIEFPYGRIELINGVIYYGV